MDSKVEEMVGLLQSLSLRDDSNNHETSISISKKLKCYQQQYHHLIESIRDVRRDVFRPWLLPILIFIPALLPSHKQHHVKLFQIIAHLRKSAISDSILAAIQGGGSSMDDEGAAATLAALASVVGVPALLPLLIELCRSQDSRLAGAKAVRHIATSIDRRDQLLPNLKPLVMILEPLIEDVSNLHVTRAAAVSIGALADAAAPDGFDVFFMVLEPMWQTVGSTGGTVVADFFTAFCSIISPWDELQASFWGSEMLRHLPLLLCQESKDDKLVALRIVKQCARFLTIDIENHMGPLFFTSFWSRRARLERENYELLLEATAVFAWRVGLHTVNRRIAEQLGHEGEVYVRMVMGVVDKAAVASGNWMEEAIADMDLLFSSR